MLSKSRCRFDDLLKDTDYLNKLNDIINNPEDFKKRINLEKKNEEYLERINKAITVEELNDIEDDEDKYIAKILEDETCYINPGSVPHSDGPILQNVTKIQKILREGFRNTNDILDRKLLRIDASNYPRPGASQGGKRKHKSRRNKKSKKSRKSKFRKNHRKSIRRRH